MTSAAEPPHNGSTDTLFGLTARGQLNAREFWLGSALLSLLAFLVYFSHLRNGGFYSDDWANGAAYFYPPDGSWFSTFKAIAPERPVLVVYVPLLYAVFGMHVALHLVWAVLLAVAMSALLFGLLRFLGVAPIHAWMVAALVLIYPWADSTHLWVTGSMVSLSISLALGGIWCALVGLRRNSWRWHAAALMLYALTILTYELPLALVAAAGLLYCLLVGWRMARNRWAADLAVVAVTGAWGLLHTPKQQPQGLADVVAHSKSIVVYGASVFSRTIWPTGHQPTRVAQAALVLLVLAGVFGSAGIVWQRARATVHGDELARWLRLAAGGLVVTGLGWIIFLPAGSYYTPSLAGVTNRFNSLAAVGLVIVAYCAFGVMGTLANRWRRELPAAGVTVALALMLGGAYLGVLHRHIGLWDDSVKTQRAVLDSVRRAFPSPPAGGTIFTSGHPAFQAVDVPVFYSYEQISGALKIEYGGRDIRAVPLVDGRRLACGEKGVSVRAPGQAPSAPVPFGKAMLINVASGAHSEPKSQGECMSVSPSYVPGPHTLSDQY